MPSGFQNEMNCSMKWMHLVVYFNSYAVDSYELCRNLKKKENIRCDTSNSPN